MYNPVCKSNYFIHVQWLMNGNYCNFCVLDGGGQIEEAKAEGRTG